MQNASHFRSGPAGFRVVFLVTVLLFPGKAFPDEWAVVGPRAMGMGGAGVAVTRGGLSTYWNPAGLAPPHASRLDTSFDVEVHASLNAAATRDVLGRIGDVADLVDDLDFDDMQARLESGSSPLTETEVQRVLKLLSEDVPALGDQGTGIVMNSSAGIAATVWQLGFSATAFGYAGGQTKVDLLHLALGDNGLGDALGPVGPVGPLSPAGQALADSLFAEGLASQDQANYVVYQAEQAGVNTSSASVQDNIRSILQSTVDNTGGSLDNFFTQNQSGADTKGLLLQEYAVGFAQPFFEIFSLGITGKVLYGMSYYKPYQLSDFQNVQDLVKDFFADNREDSVSWGVDVGAIVQPLSWFSLGVVGKNLNRPEFKYAGPGNYVVEPQVRAGLGVTPLEGLTLAADIDCYVNHSEALPGYQSQMVGAGVEYALFDALFVRGGVSKNLRESKEDVLLHAGLGVRVWMLEFDLAACLTPEFSKVKWDDHEAEIPERAGLSLMLGVNIPLD